jgi:hypothetical protein
MRCVLGYQWQQRHQVGATLAGDGVTYGAATQSKRSESAYPHVHVDVPRVLFHDLAAPSSSASSVSFSFQVEVVSWFM